MTDEDFFQSSEKVASIVLEYVSLILDLLNPSKATAASIHST